MLKMCFELYFGHILLPLHWKCPKSVRSIHISDSFLTWVDAIVSFYGMPWHALHPPGISNISMLKISKFGFFFCLGARYHHPLCYSVTCTHHHLEITAMCVVYLRFYTQNSHSKFTLKILHQKVTSTKFCTKRSQVTNFAPKGHKYKNQKKFGCTCDLLTQNFDFISSKKKIWKF